MRSISALSALCGSLLLLLTGCSDDPATRIHRAAKLTTIGILTDAPDKADQLERIAAQVDELLTAESIDDSVIANLASTLARSGEIDRREAMAIALVAQELWAEFRPADGVLLLSKPKVRAALQAFASGIRAGITFARAFDAGPPAGA